MKQSIYIFGMIFLGILLPFGHEWVFLIRYNLMAMLYFAFLSIQFEWKILQWSHLFTMLLNLALPLLFFAVLLPFDRTSALVGFVIGICPTAAAAPVLAQFLRSNIGYVTTSVLLSNPLVALTIPFILPQLLGVGSEVSVGDVFLPVMMVIGVPLLLSVLTQRTSVILTEKLLHFRMISFYLFLLNVWIGSGKATHFILHESDEAITKIMAIALITGVVCFLQFKMGELLTREPMKIASGLALGRKNTMFGLWLALTFVEPTVALGPIFYIVFQNSYNSYQILQMERRQKAVKNLEV